TSMVAGSSSRTCRSASALTMQILNKVPSIDFIGQMRAALTLSAVLLVISIGAIAIRGLNYGLDFTGGVLLEVSYSSPVELTAVRTALEQAGYEEVTVQTFGSVSDIMIRLPPVADAEAGTALGVAVLDVL